MQIRGLQIKQRGTVISNLIKGDKGLVDSDTIRKKLQGYPLELVFRLREELISKFPGLREKLNLNSRYLGYANGNRSDALYVYIQKNQLVLDVRVSKEEAESLRKQRFRVNPRNNFQCRAGWLTGVSVPLDTKKLDVIVELASLALEE